MSARIICIILSLALGLGQAAYAEEAKQGAPAPIRAVAAIVGLPFGAITGMLTGAISGAADNVTMIMNPMHPTSSTLIMKPLHIILGSVTGAIKGLGSGASKGAKTGWNLGK